MSAPAGAWRPRSKVEVEKWQKTLQNSRPIKPITLLADQEIAAEDAFGGSQHFEPSHETPVDRFLDPEGTSRCVDPTAAQRDGGKIMSFQRYAWP